MVFLKGLGHLLIDDILFVIGKIKSDFTKDSKRLFYQVKGGKHFSESHFDHFFMCSLHIFM